MTLFNKRTKAKSGGTPLELQCRLDQRCPCIHFMIIVGAEFCLTHKKIGDSSLKMKGKKRKKKERKKGRERKRKKTHKRNGS